MKKIILIAGFLISNLLTMASASTADIKVQVRANLVPAMSVSSVGNFEMQAFQGVDNDVKSDITMSLSGKANKTIEVAVDKSIKLTDENNHSIDFNVVYKDITGVDVSGKLVTNTVLDATGNAPDIVLEGSSSITTATVAGNYTGTVNVDVRYL